MSWKPKIALGVGLALAAGHAQARQDVFEQENGTWYRTDESGRFRVDMDVISVRFAPGVADVAAFKELLPEGSAAVGLDELRLVRSNKLGIVDLRLPAGADLFEVLAALRASGLVALAEENTIGEYVGVPNDPQFNQQWHFVNNGQTGGTADADVDADLAWDLENGDPSIIVSVLDSGTDVQHVDLVDNTWTNPGEIDGNGIDDDNNGFIDDFYGWDFNHNNNSVPGPFNHGTIVAGIVGARTNNSTGVAGMAGGFHPDDGVSVMNLGVGDFGPNGSILDDAIIYAADNGGRVITMSLTVGQSTAIDNAIVYAHDVQRVFVDCAAGNSGSSGVGYPARHPLVISVAATDHDDDRASFSSIGPQNWVAAPGVDIRSTDKNNGYTSGSGTSFASPHVAGTAGLLLSVLPTLQPESVKEILKITADDVEQAGFDNGTGWGRINAHRAVQHVLDSDCNGNGVYDPEDIADGTSQDQNGNGIPDECEVTSYCTAKSGLVCGTPAIAWSGAPSATQSSGFELSSAPARALRNGLVLYTDQGPAATPFQGGLLCVQSPSRTTVVNSGGTAGACDGLYAIDMNAFAQGNLGGSPQAFLQLPGTQVNAQWWGRDSVATGSFLSDGVEYAVGP